MIHLLYIANEEGSRIWHFVHPKIREDILEKIAGKDHAAIANLCYALATFGYETLGTNLQVVVFENAKMIFRYIKIEEDKTYLAIAVVDLMDQPSTVWRKISSFIKRYKDDLMFLERISQEPIPIEEVERTKLKLRREFITILDKSVRKFSILGRRDSKNLVAALIISLVFYFIMVGITYWIYKFTPIGSEMSSFAGVVFFLDFLLPAIFIGWITGYWKGGIINGLIVMIIALMVLASIWWDALVAISSSLLGLPSQALLAGILIASSILGGTMGLLAAATAWILVETRTLVPP